MLAQQDCLPFWTVRIFSWDAGLCDYQRPGYRPPKKRKWRTREENFIQNYCHNRDHTWHSAHRDNHSIYISVQPSSPPYSFTHPPIVRVITSCAAVQPSPPLIVLTITVTLHIPSNHRLPTHPIPMQGLHCCRQVENSRIQYSCFRLVWSARTNPTLRCLWFCTVLWRGFPLFLRFPNIFILFFRFFFRKTKASGMQA